MEVGNSAEQGASSYPSPGGYDCIFANELNPRFICPVCLAALRDPVQTKCGHRFCSACLHGVSKNMRFARCPVDKTWFDCQKEVFADVATEREVLSLDVTCANKEAGCVFVGELRNLQEHTAVCPEGTVKCDLNCGANVKRKEVHVHRQICPRRKEPCQHCSMVIAVADHTKHQLLACAKFPVNCSLCSETGILREDISKHMDPNTGNCPMVIISCPFKNHGCTFQDKRMNMKDHIVTGGHTHMLLMSLKLTQQEETMKEQQKELTEIHRHGEQLAKRVVYLEKIVDRQEKYIVAQSEYFANEYENGLYSGHLEWRVPIPDRITASLQLTSPHFYTGKPGYRCRFRLQMFPQSDESFITSLVFLLERGPFDDLLDSPFNASFVADLYDHHESAKKRFISRTCRIQRQDPQNDGDTSLRGSLEVALSIPDISIDRYRRNGNIHLSIQVTVNSERE